MYSIWLLSVNWIQLFGFWVDFQKGGEVGLHFWLWFIWKCHLTKREVYHANWLSRVNAICKHFAFHLELSSQKIRLLFTSKFCCHLHIFLDFEWITFHGRKHIILIFGELAWEPDRILWKKIETLFARLSGDSFSSAILERVLEL